MFQYLQLVGGCSIKCEAEICKFGIDINKRKTIGDGIHFQGPVFGIEIDLFIHLVQPDIRKPAFPVEHINFTHGILIPLRHGPQDINLPDADL